MCKTIDRAATKETWELEVPLTEVFTDWREAQDNVQIMFDPTNKVDTSSRRFRPCQLVPCTL